MPHTVRPIKADELVAWFEAISTAFYIWPSDPEVSAELRGPTMDLERTLGAFEGDAVVGTYRSFATQLTLPGGARVPANAISAVTVRPTHRRQGILGQMIAQDTVTAAEREDVVSVLIASEWPIYVRFGFGPATWKANWILQPRGMTFQVSAVGSVEVVGPKKARELLPAIYAEYAATQPGEIDRAEMRWDMDLGIKEFPGRPRWRGSIAIHRDDSGRPDGFARYHGEELWGEGGKPEHVMILDELHGVTRAAEIDLWRHLAQMDLTATIKAENRRAQEPLPWYLTDARVARSTGEHDFLWVRVLDVPRLLGERRYERDGALVLEVRDDMAGKPGPAAGRYRLEVRDGAGGCEATETEPDLTIEARHLGAASLGGTRLADAVQAGGATEHRAGALREADLLLRTADPPWCTTWF